jgi:glycerate dehydrogenase
MKLMKEGALLLNLGRGNIVNEDDLAAIIDEKNIIAGLDVLGSEPMKEDNPLKNIKKKENLFITPHLAWGGIESRKKLIDMIVKNIEEFSS